MPDIHIIRPDGNHFCLCRNKEAGITCRPGLTIEVDGNPYSLDEAPSSLPDLIAGRDYGIRLDEGDPSHWHVAPLDRNPSKTAASPGFTLPTAATAWHGQGGDGVPSINPLSVWDIGFRPQTADPRGMTLVTVSTGRLVWVDIYLLGTQHRQDGTSRCGAVIADGRSLPQAAEGEGMARKLDFPTAEAIYAAHGKRLLTAEEFFAAAYGVKERCSRDGEPDLCGETHDGAARFVSACGLADATAPCGNGARTATRRSASLPRRRLVVQRRGRRLPLATWATGRAARTVSLGSRRLRPPDACLTRESADHLPLLMRRTRP